MLCAESAIAGGYCSSEFLSGAGGFSSPPLLKGKYIGIPHSEPKDTGSYFAAGYIFLLQGAESGKYAEGSGFSGRGA